MKKFQRRQFLQLAAGAGLRYPEPHRASPMRRPIHRGRCASVIGYTPAAPADITARLMGQWLSEKLGQSFADREPAGRRHQYCDRAGAARDT